MMRSFIRGFFLVCCAGSFSGAFAQTTTSGFAVVTPVSGNVAGLIATETLRMQSSAGTDGATVPPSPLLQAASFLVPIGQETENTTGIAISNPSLGSGGINLIVTDQTGTIILNSTFQLGPRGHFSRFLNELFATPPATFPTPLLLTVSSEIPVGITALNFRAGDVTSIPTTSLSTPVPLPVQPLTPQPTTTSAIPGFGLGVTTTSTDVIGGLGALLFPQVANGGGWFTEITVGNTSAGTQTIRIDFFNSDGVITQSLTDIVIPSRGVFFFSTQNSNTSGQ